MASARSGATVRCLIFLQAATASVAAIESVDVTDVRTGEQLVRQSFHGARAKAFDAIEKAADALAEGKIDLLVHDAPTIWWLAARRKAQGLVPIQKLLTEEHLAWAVRSENEELLNKINQTMDRWNRDGTLERIVKRWMPYAE